MPIYRDLPIQGLMSFMFPCIIRQVITFEKHGKLQNFAGILQKTLEGDLLIMSYCYHNTHCNKWPRAAVHLGLHLCQSIAWSIFTGVPSTVPSADGEALQSARKDYRAEPLLTWVMLNWRNGLWCLNRMWEPSFLITSSLQWAPAGTLYMGVSFRTLRYFQLGNSKTPSESVVLCKWVHCPHTHKGPSCNLCSLPSLCNYPGNSEVLQETCLHILGFWQIIQVI